MAGGHLRWVHRELAATLVANGHAEVVARNGKIRRVRLIEIAAHNAAMIGPPTALTAQSYGTRFTRRVKADSGVSWTEFHPRSLDRE